MRCLPVTKLEEGMVVGKTIYTSDGRPLLRRGIVLDKKHIDRLKSLGIPVIYIEEEPLKGIDVEDVILDKVRMNAVQEARRLMLKIRKELKFYNKKISDLDLSEDIEGIKGVVDSLMREVFRTKEALYSFIDIRGLEDFLYGHMVNVTVLGMMTGLSLGYKPDRLFPLGLGLFLHDVGKAILDDAVLADQKLLGDEKNPLIIKHTVVGYEIVKRIPGVSLLSAHIAYQHHERLDGKGYPRGLYGSDIHEFAKIASVVNTYDILVSGSPFQSRVKPNEAIEIIRKGVGTLFDRDVVEAFLKNVAIYPVGSMVRLSTGEIAVVSQTKRGFPDAPIVRVIKDWSGNDLEIPVEIDLSIHENIKVEEMIE
ncbi:MAG: HD domain-containing protein [Synergistetes bacterium]|nr:HD domain-containing protein [Synergistota bacterium]MDW8193013.1 HD domain-containing phosphohydrolase [Synergistota bacterium]